MRENIEVFRPRPLEPSFGEVIIDERIIYAGYGSDEEIKKKAEEKLTNESN